MIDQPQVVRINILAMQVCVPKSFTDAQVKEFAERENPCGTTHGWQVRHDEPARVQCTERAECVHIVLEA